MVFGYASVQYGDNLTVTGVEEIVGAIGTDQRHTFLQRRRVDPIKLYPGNFGRLAQGSQRRRRGDRERQLRDRLISLDVCHVKSAHPAKNGLLRVGDGGRLDTGRADIAILLYMPVRSQFHNDRRRAGGLKLGRNFSHFSGICW